MTADIVPVLAAITGLDSASAETLFAEALAETTAAEGGRVNTRSFAEAVLLFRSEFPFALADLQAGMAAKEAVQRAGAAAASR